MRASLLGLGGMLVALAMQGGPAMALTEAQVRRACIGAIAGEGLRNYRMSSPEVTRTRDGGSMSGQLSRGSDRREFVCVLDAQAAVTELVINPLTSSR